MVQICNGYEYQMNIVRGHLSEFHRDDDDFSRLFKLTTLKNPSFKELNDYITCEAKFLRQSVFVKDALLDICSFFNNWDWDQMASILGNHSLKKLKELELAKTETNKVFVPDTVLPFGLSRAQGNRVTKVADLHTFICGDKVPPTLRILKLKLEKFTDCIDLPKTLPKACKLVELDISGCDEEEFHKAYCEFHAFQNLILSQSPLKEIDLSYCKGREKLPDSFAKLSTLLVLKLTACSYLAKLPERFEDLELNRLCLESCKRLKALPQRIGQLSESTVSLSWCFSLPEISYGFISLIQAHVEHLIIVDCAGLLELPEDFTKGTKSFKKPELEGL
ncbi:hypothetical protein KI387_033522 [Taxus chinensis]|uniref:Uncharacterized protein n=1 Tax=Taxus chinensis TaxID=29808 RepID=A0AA38F5F3_TAXCH|nr:hypothetical protein KI387_033522 [Taxus chinensis]